MIPARHFLVLLAMLLATGFLLRGELTRAVPLNRPFAEFPAAHAGWTMKGEDVFSAEVLRQLKASDYLARTYAGPDGQTVNLYVGYHNGGKEAGEIHSPKHCLPGSGWALVSSRSRQLPLEGGSLEVVQAVYQRGADKATFLYWYQVMDRAVTSEVGLKAAEVLNALLHGRKDAAFVRVVLAGHNEAVEARGADFIRDFLPLIREFLPR